jgi:hypothetical protein
MIMKYLNVLVVLVALFLAACSKKAYTVDAVGNTNVTPAKANTYGFASQVDNKLDEGFFFLNDLILKAEIRDAVKHEMDSRGYTHTASQPDLIVNFRVFDKPAEIQSVDQLGSNYWAAGEINGYTNPQTVRLKEGSLMMHLVDRKTGKLVWQGYASGLMDGNVFTKEGNKIDEAVSMVFDQFKFRADNL